MLKGFKLLIQAGIGFAGCVAVIGLAQASTSLTYTHDYTGNMAWQDIKGTSYTFVDTNGDGQITVGETVTFIVDMHKTNWGTHDFDALKVWIDHTPVNLTPSQSEWHYDPSNVNQLFYGAGPADDFSYRPWTGGDKFITFDYLTTAVGVLDLTVSVMCSRDLSWLTPYGEMDKPTAQDWGAWYENIHRDMWWKQGETEDYQLTVVASPVPEPQTYAMLLAGLGLMGFMVRRRKSLES
jgi:hypothetical protein